MLPPTFNVDALSSSQAKAIATALKTYGGYLADRTTGTFAITAETGSGWENAVYHGGSGQADLNAIRDGLRAVTVSTLIDANGVPFTPTPLASMNLLSMRGPWNGFGSFDTAQNLFIIPSGTTPGYASKVIYSVNYSDAEWWRKWQNNGVWYLNPVPGTQYKLSATGSGAVQGSIHVRLLDNTMLFASSALAPGQQQTFTWPAAAASSTMVGVYVRSLDGTAASIRLEMVPVTN